MRSILRNAVSMIPLDVVIPSPVTDAPKTKPSFHKKKEGKYLLIAGKVLAKWRRSSITRAPVKARQIELKFLNS